MKFLGLLALLAATAAAQSAPWRTEGASPYPGMNGVKRAVARRAPNPAPVLEPRATGCNANNCARAVTGTRSGKMPDVTSRQTDCSSFMQATVLTNYGGHPISTVYPTAVPSYASACSTPVNAQSAYSSACSCWGIPPTATTSAAPQACVLNHQSYSCADGVNGQCYCWEDYLGNLYCDGSFFSGYIAPDPFPCVSDSECPSNLPICAIDGFCDFSVSPSECT